MTSKYGMFKEHIYLTPSDPPPAEGSGSASGSRKASRSNSPVGTAQRDHGLNFKATVGRVGKGNDATFEAFKGLYNGDKYIDPGRRRLLEDGAQRKQQVAPAPFKAASPMKISTTPGDFVGTLQGKVPYIPGRSVTLQKTKADIGSEPRGFYTSPAKKGTYGFNKTTLSERQGFRGVATEYEYQHEPDEMQRQRRIQEREADFAARQPQPFRPSHPPKKGGAGVPNITISKGRGIAGEYEYVLGADPAVAPRLTADADAAAAGKQAVPPVEKTDAGPAFRPSSINPRHLGKHPEYLHDPEVPKLEAEHARNKAEQQRLATTGAWRPNNAQKTDMIRSIVRMNLK
ncbi:hypothetical protein PLESTB_001587300 [Pleodorina starrii]|uniref:Cilia-and flagella-associated protein 96 n=1 Tax=Pleodorina starrii TaxID=330485 RepID=A0A9W6F8F7_9CHLO|nr:hypothetical protein PLESTM_000583400 [Pleodorina starrii]GLC60224.1 hypothetical protein PLESTB_001587300 [Pleodorina starrii]GLC65984.1 hypothetical protein PLESTF_000369300 [Pleodorina starrii]